MIAAEYAGCMPSTKPSKRSGKSNWTWWEATLTMGGRASVNFTYMLCAYTTLWEVSRGLIKGGAYNRTKKSVSKSYNRQQNELRHFALKGLFEFFFFLHEARIVTYIIQATVSLTLKILLRSTLQQKVLHKLCSFPFVQTSAHCWSATKTETM